MRVAILIGYILSALFLLTIALIGRNPQSRIATLPKVWRTVLSHRTTRVALTVLWWWYGYHFLVHVIPPAHMPYHHVPHAPLPT
jgi:hypothetical protein